MNFKRGFLNKGVIEPEFAAGLILVIVLGLLFLWALYQKVKGVQ